MKTRHVLSVELAKPLLAEAGQHEGIRPVRVGLDRRVRAAVGDLGHPDAGGVAEPRVRARALRVPAAAPAQLLAQGRIRGGARDAPPLDPPGDAVEVAEPASGDPSAILAGETHRAVLPDI